MGWTILIMLCLVPVFVQAQGVQVDRATNSPNLSGKRSGSWTHTVSGSQRYLVVGLAGWDNTSTLGSVRVTFNGVTMPLVGGTDSAGQNKAKLWGLVNPPVGTYLVRVSNIPSGFAELGGGSISFTGVHQTTPTAGLVTELDGNASVTVQMNAGDLGADIFYSGQGPGQPVIGPGGTKRTSVFCCGIKWFMMGTEPGSGSVVMSWTDPDGPADRAQTAVVLKRAGTGPVLDTQAPAVAILTPTSSPTYITNQPAVTIGGTAQDNVGVARVLYSTSAGQSGQASGTTAWSFPLTMPVGTTTVTVEAFDAANNRATDSLAVTVLAPEPEPTGPITVEWQYQGTVGEVFQVERCTQPCGPMEPVEDLAITTRSWTDTAVEDGADYCYWMAVKEGTVVHPYSNTMCSP